MKGRSNHHYPRWPVLTLVLILIAGDAWSNDDAQDTRVITTPSTTSEVSVVLGKQIVRQLYDSCGLDIRYLDVPAARAVLMAEKGQSDGELARIPMAVKENAPLLPLDTPIDEARLVSVILNGDPKHSEASLEGKRIGFLNGYRMIASVLPEDVTQVATSDTFQLINLLERGRIDVALTLEWDALAAKRKNPRLSIGKPLLKAPIYHWVHKSRKDDIPCLSRALESMKASGDLDRIITDGIGPEAVQ
ncbi:transporter substrate-binding domain-containing protein [Marinobacter sp. 71-i]|uniref:Transporter substrate-binding domain-containing protein n=1 Tax=Marinobacter iranensis TaxID=2962607 RepID=A0ABT5Y7M7_9GAMM|nr:transporter substrate-binding domain-containing protein [Marinobacter iranensis]MDF0749677.1 transporter substrate-binding domain-containing protein [Marinobacter iranensis]